MSKVAKVGEAEFANEVENYEGPVVVDFTASWCPPCKMLAPVFDRVSEQFAGRVKFLKVDVDETPGVSARYGVQTIPNLLFFKNGQVVNQSVGFVAENQLTAKVDAILTN